MKRTILFIIIFLLLPCAKMVCYAETNDSIAKSCEINGINYEEATTLVKDIQSALKLNNKSKVSELIAYPLRINFSEKGKISYKLIKNKNEFLKSYDKLFDTKFKDKILQQDPKDIFCNAKGAMIANGLIWFNKLENEKKLLIIAINK